MGEASTKCKGLLSRLPLLLSLHSLFPCFMFYSKPKLNRMHSSTAVVHVHVSTSSFIELKYVSLFFSENNEDHLFHLVNNKLILTNHSGHYSLNILKITIIKISNSKL